MVSTAGEGKGAGTEDVQRSMMWLRQMAQLSTTMSQAQRATAFHCIQVVSPCPVQKVSCKSWPCSPS